jgi:hypothetical protein
MRPLPSSGAYETSPAQCTHFFRLTSPGVSLTLASWGAPFRTKSSKLGTIPFFNFEDRSANRDCDFVGGSGNLRVAEAVDWFLTGLDAGAMPGKNDGSADLAAAEEQQAFIVIGLKSAENHGEMVSAGK